VRDGVYARKPGDARGGCTCAGKFGNGGVGVRGAVFGACFGNPLAAGCRALLLRGQNWSFRYRVAKR
jgi:hypothetical protein